MKASALDPPFLELAFYIGESNDVEKQFRVLVPDLGDNAPRKLGFPDIVGLSEGLEQVEVLHGAIIVLRTEGEAFCGTARKNRGRLMNLGQRVYERFIQVAETLDCTYAAILVEYTLETPRELRRDARTLAFRDFYVSRSNVTSSVIDECVRIAGANAYVEVQSKGVYVSMSAEFNPEHKGLDSAEAQERSCQIGARLGEFTR